MRGGNALNSNDSHKTKWKPCWQWFGLEIILFLSIVLGMILLAIMVALIPFKAHAAACLSIDVPPQAVISQPDGDTFHVFAFQPGGVIKIRVQGVNTPELNAQGWAEAKAFTKDWLAKGVFRVNTCGRPTLDRIVATVERNGRTLAQDLILAGYGKE